MLVMTTEVVPIVTIVFLNSRIELLSADNQRKIVHIDEKFCEETAQKIQVMDSAV